MEVDHVFIRARHGAPEAEVLKAFGLTEGTPNKHPGQGTANRRFFFHNVFIELLWLDDVVEVQSESTRPTLLFERLSENSAGISPFGICFRPTEINETKPPFPYWRYQPSYLPNSLAVEIASDVPLSEPMWFFLSFATRPDLAPSARLQPLVHQTGIKEVTSVSVSFPVANKLSTAGRSIVQSECMYIAEGEKQLLEICFDNETQSCSHDFRPALPLIIKW